MGMGFRIWSVWLALSSASVPATPARAAAAEPRAEVRTVIERYLKATGGRAAWEADSTVREVAKISAFGLEGQAERWTARPDRSATRTRIGPLELREGTIGGRAWRLDHNGKLQWLDGRELDEARSSAWFDHEMWCAADQGGGQVRFVGEERDSTGRLLHLEVIPPVGKPRQLYFDSKSGLLVKMTQRNDAQGFRSELLDYQKIAGRLRARLARTHVDGAQANDVSAELDTVQVGVAVDSSLFLPPRDQARDFRFLDGGATALVPMRYGERHVWVKAALNGNPPADFLLDTGASVTVIDSAYADRIGLVTQGELAGTGAGARGRFTFSNVGLLRVDGEGEQGVAIEKQQVVVASLNPFLAPVFWRETAGVLGYDFISRFVMTIDYEKQTLRLDDPSSFVYRGKGTSVPVIFSGGIPVIHGKLDGRYEGDFRVDVGSGSSLDLHTPFVRENGLAKKMGKTLVDEVGGFGGAFSRTVARGKNFSIGPYAIRDPLVGLSETTTGAMASEDYAGNIGNRILDRFRVTFDYSRKQLYLEPTKRLAAREPYSKLGAQFNRQSDRVVVGSVIPESPASRAGIEEGDTVRTIGGRPVTDYTVDELSRLFEEGPDGSLVAIELKKPAGLRRLVQIRLKTLI